MNDRPHYSHSGISTTPAGVQVFFAIIVADKLPFLVEAVTLFLSSDRKLQRPPNYYRHFAESELDLVGLGVVKRFDAFSIHGTNHLVSAAPTLKGKRAELSSSAILDQPNLSPIVARGTV